MDLQLRLNALQAQQDMAQREAVIRDGRSTALESQVRTEEAAAAIAAQGASPRLPPPLAGAPPRHIDTAHLASIPDDRLAASDARVRAASKNRR
jgi:hypothetical protein